jgi:hypothetical protein
MTEILEHIIKEKIRRSKIILDCIGRLRHDYYNTQGVYPTVVFMSETLLRELELIHRWCISSADKVSKTQVFNMGIRIDYNMNDDEIHMGRIMATKINNE